MSKNYLEEEKYPVLSRVNNPSDLKTLTHHELEQLTEEIRNYIIEVVSENGGHLAPNLGVVEITVALHYVLNSPKDKIIWDVSHQSYAHKILTGRKKLFTTLRKFGGISGFTRREESEHDVYTTGHASTSIAFAMGLAEARDKRGGQETIVAIIGDGALTGGVSFEALNNLGHSKTRLIVIINDNEMSIAKNVGAMSGYLTRIRLDPAYNKLREEVEKVMKKIPGLGEKVCHIGESIKESIKALVVPGMIFEELGLRYFGPIDGHNLERLIKAISLAKEINEPVVIHVITTKGKGFKPAENHPEKFHGSSPFEIDTGEPRKKSSLKTYTEVFGESLSKLADFDERIIGITAAMPSGTGLDIFQKSHPERFYDVGIAEQFAVSFAAGLAAEGHRPVCAIYSTFLERAYDQVIQDICLQGVPVVFAIDRGGLVGEDGPTHHGVFDISYLRAIPNMVVAVPSDEMDLSNLLYSSFKWNKPCAIRYPRGTGTGVSISENWTYIEPGKGRFLRNGKDIALIGVGKPVYEAVKAARILEKKGILATVFDARFAKPLDKENILEIATTHSLLITVEDNVVAGGFGEGIISLLNDNSVKTQVINLGIPDIFITHGTPDELYRLIGLDGESIASKILELFSRIGTKTNGRIEKAFKKAITRLFKNG